MAVIDVRFQIDSEVHPELHALLAALAGSARGERFRQLAALGLIWEELRLQRQPTASAPIARAAAALARDGVPDLALSVPPAERAEPDRYANELRSVVARLPVLTDVIETPEMPSAGLAGLSADAGPKRAAPARRKPVREPAAAPRTRTPARARDPQLQDDDETVDLALSAGSQTLDPRLDDAAADLGLEELAAHPPIPDLVPARKSVTRSRLQRMKDMGLFRNE